MRARVLVCLLLAAALAGCQESGFDESKETVRPLKVQDALGDIGGTKVPGQAKRPATLTLDALDDTLALGVKPVWASVPGGRVPAHLRAAARGVEPAPPATGLDMAAVEAADPDVILASKQDQERLYPELSRIAPTIVTDAPGAGWQLNLRLHGEALGRTNDAERLLIGWDRGVARARRRIAGDRVVSVLLVTRSDVRAAGADSFAAKLLGDAGLTRPRAQERPGESLSVRGEQLDGELILLAVAPGAQETARRLERSPTWRRLEAVRSGAVMHVDPAVWWSRGGIHAARAALGDLVAAP